LAQGIDKDIVFFYYHIRGKYKMNYAERVKLDKRLSSFQKKIMGEGEGKMNEKEKRFVFKVTRMDKARQIVAALWNMAELPTEDNRARWREARRLATGKLSMENLNDLWEKAKAAIGSR
jgi:hypothetical protein